MGKKVFLTGITGLLGAFLAKELVGKGTVVYALIRPTKDQSTNDRLESIIKFVADNNSEYKKLKKNIIPVKGDIIYPRLGIEDDGLLKVIGTEITAVFHSAAITGFKIPLDQARKVNVYGTKNLLEFIFNINKNKNLEKFHHISTMYIGGNGSSHFSENEILLRGEDQFNNTYELSKYEAEIVVEQFKRSGAPISIYRPSIITGDSSEGKTNNFRLFYQPLHFFANEVFQKFPGRLDVTLNLINIDVAASVIIALSELKHCGIFHIINSKSVRVGKFLDIAASFFRFRKPIFIPKEKFNFDELTYVQKQLASPFVPYLNQFFNFNGQGTFEILKQRNISVPSFDKNNLLKIFDYCLKSGFIKKGIK